jgi:hypothetical protein
VHYTDADVDVTLYIVGNGICTHASFILRGAPLDMVSIEGQR